MAFYIGGGFLSPPSLKPPKGLAAVKGSDCLVTQILYHKKKTLRKEGLDGIQALLDHL